MAPATGSQTLLAVSASPAPCGPGIKAEGGDQSQPHSFVCQTVWLPPTPGLANCSRRCPFPKSSLSPGLDAQKAFGTSGGSQGFGTSMSRPPGGCPHQVTMLFGSSELHPPYALCRPCLGIQDRCRTYLGPWAPAGGKSWWFLSQPESTCPRAPARIQSSTASAVVVSPKTSYCES